jgi:hypothetical protein
MYTNGIVKLRLIFETLTIPKLIQIFANWAIVFFGQFFEYYESSPKFLATFSLHFRFYIMRQKMSGATEKVLGYRKCLGPQKMSWATENVLGYRKCLGLLFWQFFHKLIWSDLIQVQSK